MHAQARWLWSGDCATTSPANCLGKENHPLASAGIKPGSRGAAFTVQEARGGGFHGYWLVVSASALYFSESLSRTITIKTGLCQRLPCVAAHSCPKLMLQFILDFLCPLTSIVPLPLTTESGDTTSAVKDQLSFKWPEMAPLDSVKTALKSFPMRTVTFSLQPA